MRAPVALIVNGALSKQEWQQGSTQRGLATALRVKFTHSSGSIVIL
jgi:hypothetical protein